MCTPWALPNDIVSFRASELVNPQLGLRPVDAVFALGIAGVFARELAALAVEVPTSVVHPVAVAILKHDVTRAEIPFPRRIAYDGHLTADRLVKYLFNIVQAVD